MGVVLAGTAVAITGARGAAESAKNAAALIEKEPALRPSIRVGNLNISPLPIPHEGKYWDRWEDSLTSLVSEFPIIIPEYVYSEYQHLASSPNPFVAGSMAEYREANRLFEEMEKVYRQKDGTHVWRVDPSWTIEFAKFREVILRPPQHLIEAVAVSTGVDAVAKAGPVFGRTRISRRDFLRWLLVGGTTATMGAVGFPVAESQGLLGTASDPILDPATHVERDFRRTMVAEHVSHIGERLTSETRSTMVYHPGHWNGIEKYLKDPALRKKQVKKYLGFKNIRGLESLFRGRHYVVKNGNLELIETAEIGE